MYAIVYPAPLDPRPAGPGARGAAAWGGGHGSGREGGSWVNYSIHGPPDPPTPQNGPITMEFDFSLSLTRSMNIDATASKPVGQTSQPMLVNANSFHPLVERSL